MHRDLIEVVAAVAPVDLLAAEHRAAALAWLRSTDDVFRREKPRTPDPHLVAYVLLVDRPARSVLLGDHRLSGLWLPPGGHVEPGEDPRTTAVRETEEELGIGARWDGEAGDAPFLVTVTTTAGDPAARHTDVSLWYAITGTVGMPLVPDEREFAGVRWWQVDDLDAGRPDPARREPHLLRALRALGLTPGRPVG